MKIIKNKTKIVFKIKVSFGETKIVPGVISDYNEFTGIYTLEEENGKKHLRGVNRIWFDTEIAQKTENSGVFELLSKT